ncbi:hypothetical protein CV742_18020 [Vibrio parahaemolyticus]|nr:hypothetical protein [Vibrio parahaemolyticus]
MSQSDNATFETEISLDEWGDFSTVIHQLEQQESKHDEPREASANQAVTESKEDAVEGLLEVVFTLSEQVASLISGVEFQFDEKNKQAVVDAAIPVFHKHGRELMGAFGDYLEEATLMIAIIGLAYSSKRQLEILKQQKIENSKHDETSETSTT